MQFFPLAVCEDMCFVLVVKRCNYWTFGIAKM